MDTAARPLGEIEQALRDDWETPPEVLCMMPAALSGPVGRARASLAAALDSPDIHLAAQLARNALCGLSGVPGAAAAETRERLSRLWHRLSAEIARVQVGGVAAVAIEEPASGKLGPVDRVCDTCGELLGPDQFGAKQGTRMPHTTCRSCRALAHAAVRRQESGGHPPPRMGDETMGAAALRSETAEPPACKVCGKSEPEVSFRTTRFGRLKTCNHCIGLRASASRRENAASAQTGSEPGAPAPRQQESDGSDGSGGSDGAGVPAGPGEASPPTAPPAPAGFPPLSIRFGRPVDLSDLLASRPGAPREMPPRENWAALAAPALLGAGLVGLAAWVLGRVFHAE